LGKNTLFYFPDKKGRLFPKSERPDLVYCPWFSCIFADKIRWGNTICVLKINHLNYIILTLKHYSFLFQKPILIRKINSGFLLLFHRFGSWKKKQGVFALQ
jgi:hypothetical protein